MTNQFVSRIVSQKSVTKSNEAAGEFDSSSNDFKSGTEFFLTAPAGTGIVATFSWIDDTPRNTIFQLVLPRLIYGKLLEGPHTEVKADVGLGVVNFDSPAPFPFGQKNNDEPNKNRAVYDNPVYLVTKRAPSNPGIYVEGKTLQGPGDVAKLPVGTVFTITTSAAEINDNYRAVSKQYLVNTFTIVG